MKKKLLLLGATGKLGVALSSVLDDDFQIISKSSKDFDAADFDAVTSMVKEEEPELVVNAVAMMGIDNCEQNPEKAFRINALYPQLLAKLSAEIGATLIHFSTSAVFNGKKNDFYKESDIPCPLNVYGATKYAGDCLLAAQVEKHYIFRIAMTFGPCEKKNQFAERMLERARNGETLRLADDVYDSPSYSIDIANEVKRVLTLGLPFGLYHVTNRGQASLYELVSHMVATAGIDATIEPASYREFTHIGLKNTNTPMTSSKLKPLRTWQRAADDFMETWKK